MKRLTGTLLLFTCLTATAAHAQLVIDPDPLSDPDSAYYDAPSTLPLESFEPVATGAPIQLESFDVDAYYSRFEKGRHSAAEPDLEQEIVIEFEEAPAPEPIEITGRIHRLYAT